MGFLRDVQRASHQISKAAGDVNAVNRGTYGKRVARRELTKNVWGPFLRGLFR